MHAQQLPSKPNSHPKPYRPYVEGLGLPGFTIYYLLFRVSVSSTKAAPAPEALADLNDEAVVQGLGFYWVLRLGFRA